MLLALFLLAPVALAQHVTSFPMLEKDGMIYLRAVVNGQAVFAMLDSGTNHTVVDESIMPRRKCVKATMLAAGGDVQGACKAEAEITVYGLPISSDVFVCKLPAGIKALIPLRELAPHGSVTLDFANRQINIQR